LIETAYRWYEKERAGLGSEFLEAIDKMVKGIAENPERFPVVRKDIRRAVLRRFHTASSSHRFRTHRGDCLLRW
jgi:hypothetical protein